MADDRLLTPDQMCWRVALTPLLHLVQALPIQPSSSSPSASVGGDATTWDGGPHTQRRTWVRPAIGVGIGAAFVQLADRPARLRMAHAA